MAYAAAITVAAQGVSFGRKYLVLQVVETGITTSTHEWSKALPFVVGTVTKIKSVLTAGDGNGTTVDPRLGEATTAVDVFDNGTPAASVTDTTNRRLTVPGGTLYGGARCDGTTGTTGNVTTTITIVEGVL